MPRRAARRRRCRARSRASRQAIGELGAVNMAALEELSTSQERKSYLDSQAADLEEAVTTLEDAIRKIDRETRELLRETFDSGEPALRLAVPDAVRRRRGEADHDRRGDPRRRRAGDGAAAGQAQQLASTCCRAARRR